MDKLCLMRKLNDDERLDCLSGEGLHLLLLMIAGCSENGEGEIFLSRINKIFDQNLSAMEIKNICQELKKKKFASFTYGLVCVNEIQDFVIMYQILHI